MRDGEAYISPGKSTARSARAANEDQPRSAKERREANDHVENLRILPVLGAGAVKVSPRVGHLHVTVDDLPWHWGDFSDTNTIVVVGLPPGQHKVLIELADPEHHVFTGQTVTFTVPGAAK